MVMRTVAAMYLQRAKLTERTKSSDVVALRRRWQLAVGSCGRLHVSETAAIRLNTRARACFGVNIDRSIDRSIDRRATGWQGFGVSWGIYSTKDKKAMEASPTIWKCV